MTCFETPSKPPRGHASQSSAALISSASLLYQESGCVSLLHLFLKVTLLHSQRTLCLYCLYCIGGN